MGTTLTMAFIAWPVLYVAHVGDSRCYLFRSGTLSRLTTDHTVAQQMLDEGIRTADPESQWHHVLWNSLGGSEQIPKPEIAKLELAPGDTVLLCSDGLTKHIGDDEIAATLGAHQTSAALCARLIERANAEGGTDNVTVVIASAEPRSTS
jgi:protein phosphatase